MSISDFRATQLSRAAFGISGLIGVGITIAAVAVNGPPRTGSAKADLAIFLVGILVTAGLSALSASFLIFSIWSINRLPEGFRRLSFIAVAAVAVFVPIAIAIDMSPQYWRTPYVLELMLKTYAAWVAVAAVAWLLCIIISWVRAGFSAQ